MRNSQQPKEADRRRPASPASGGLSAPGKSAAKGIQEDAKALPRVRSPLTPTFLRLARGGCQ